MHFEIHAEDMDRCEKFYTELFGRKFTKWDGGDAEYRIIITGESWIGINGGMVKRIGRTPTQDDPVKGNVCTMEVESVDVMLEKAISLGAIVALPKMPIPGMGWLAYLIDTEKNIFGIMHNDTSAK